MEQVEIPQNSYTFNLGWIRISAYNLPPLHSIAQTENHFVIIESNILAKRLMNKYNNLACKDDTTMDSWVFELINDIFRNVKFAVEMENM